MAKIIQANVNRSRAALDVLYAEARREGKDIIVVSEPNRTAMNNPGWISDPRLDSAIRVMPNGPAVIKHGAGQGYVWVESKEFVIFSCYVSPNVSLEAFQEYINNVQSAVRRHTKDVIITGDFNSSSVTWGSRETNARGEIILDWQATDSLILHNTGTNPTFIRGEQESHLDLTMSTENISRKIKNWAVLTDRETLSDHEWITFDILSQTARET